MIRRQPVMTIRYAVTTQATTFNGDPKDWVMVGREILTILASRVDI
jgi:hypothetical protein